MKRPFCQYQKFWPVDLDSWTTFEKKLNLRRAFWIQKDKAFISCIDISMARPFYQYQNFLSHDLDLQLWPTFEKNLTFALT